MEDSPAQGPFRATQLWHEVIQGFMKGMPVTRHRLQLKLFNDCFSASEAIPWLLQYLRQNPRWGPGVTWTQTAMLLTKFHQAGVFEDVRGSKCNQILFTETEGRLYRMTHRLVSELRLPLANRTSQVLNTDRYNSSGEVQDVASGKARPLLERLRQTFFRSDDPKYDVENRPPTVDKSLDIAQSLFYVPAPLMRTKSESELAYDRKQQAEAARERGLIDNSQNIVERLSSQSGPRLQFSSRSVLGNLRRRNSNYHRKHRNTQSDSLITCNFNAHSSAPTGRAVDMSVSDCRVTYKRNVASVEEDEDEDQRQMTWHEALEDLNTFADRSLRTVSVSGRLDCPIVNCSIGTMSDVSNVSRKTIDQDRQLQLCRVAGQIDSLQSEIDKKGICDTFPAASQMLDNLTGEARGSDFSSDNLLHNFNSYNMAQRGTQSASNPPQRHSHNVVGKTSAEDNRHQTSLEESRLWIAMMDASVEREISEPYLFVSEADEEKPCDEELRLLLPLANKLLPDADQECLVVALQQTILTKRRRASSRSVSNEANKTCFVSPSCSATCEIELPRGKVAEKKNCRRSHDLRLRSSGTRTMSNASDIASPQGKMPITSDCSAKSVSLLGGRLSGLPDYDKKSAASLGGCPSAVPACITKSVASLTVRAMVAPNCCAKSAAFSEAKVIDPPDCDRKKVASLRARASDAQDYNAAGASVLGTKALYFHGVIPEEIKKVYRDEFIARLKASGSINTEKISNVIGVHQVGNIIHNSTLDARSNGVKFADRLTRAIPQWVLNAMKYLAYWPDRVDSRADPVDPREVLKAIGDYFSTQQPLYSAIEYNLLILAMNGVLSENVDTHKPASCVTTVLPPSRSSRPTRSPSSRQCSFGRRDRHGSCVETTFGVDSETPRTKVFGHAALSLASSFSVIDDAVMNHEDSGSVDNTTIGVTRSFSTIGYAAIGIPRSSSAVGGSRTGLQGITTAIPKKEICRRRSRHASSCASEHRQSASLQHVSTSMPDVTTVSHRSNSSCSKKQQSIRPIAGVDPLQTSLSASRSRYSQWQGYSLSGLDDCLLSDRPPSNGTVLLTRLTHTLQSLSTVLGNPTNHKGRVICIEELRLVEMTQLINLVLDPCNRRRLNAVLPLIAKMSANNQLSLDLSIKTKDTVVRMFAKSILSYASSESPISESSDVQATAVLRFMLDHYSAVTRHPRTFQLNVDQSLAAGGLNKEVDHRIESECPLSIKIDPPAAFADNNQENNAPLNKNQTSGCERKSKSSKSSKPSMLLRRPLQQLSTIRF